MKPYIFAAIVSVFVTVLALSDRSQIVAQDEAKTPAKLTFHLRSVAESADPDPQKQSAEERLKTLRKRMTEANQLLEHKQYKEFFNDFIDPFWLARYAAGAGVSVEELLNQLLEKDPESMQRFSKTINSTLKAEPKWLLDGRAASFTTDRSSHTAEFWIYYDGKWRISPET